MRVKNLLSFFEKKTGITEEEQEELFITSDMESLSAKKISDLEETQWRRLLFFLVRLKQCKNFVIHDFAKGMPYDFIVDFKKNIAKMKQNGCSILYLSDDVFFAPEIGDRVGFMKKGKLLLELNSRKMKNMSLQELYFQFMAER
ncbi:MAG: hypothetical protein GY757_60670, partial [bacterium]|nr:hypothetical protein [bacterium]